MLNTRRPVSPATRGHLAKISKRYGSLFFDPATGVSKFDSDVVFDDGDDSLKPGAEDVLRKLVAELKSSEGQELKVVIVGHTDDRLIAKKPVREKYADNFRLSTARAHTVADTLRNLGLAHQRMVIVGAGPHQPVALQYFGGGPPQESPSGNLRPRPRRPGDRLDRVDPEPLLTPHWGPSNPLKKQCYCSAKTLLANTEQLNSLTLTLDLNLTPLPNRYVE